MNKNPFDFFERIYCINLSYRTDKWEQSLEEFKNIGINNKVIRFEGIKYDSNIYGYMYARGGCVASHREIINICKKENVSNVLVFEDDVQFRNEPIKNLKLSLNELINQSWDIYYLGLNVTTEVHQNPLIRVSKNLLKVRSALTTHAIAYNNSCYDDILNNIPEGDKIIEWLYKNESIDGWFMRYFLDTKNVFCANEFLATQRENISDIDLRPITYTKSIEDNFYQLRPA
jgi:GR25 family glycosyltransferase involved in LPS biosynthesis